MKKLIIPLLALLSLIVGFQISKSTEGKTPINSGGLQPQASGRGSSSAISMRKYEESLRSSQGDRRWLSVISVIERTPLDGLLDLAHASEEDKEVLRLIALRWASEDPQHCLEALLGDLTPEGIEEILTPDIKTAYTVHSRIPAHLFKYLVEEWASQDHAALLTALETLTALDARRLGTDSVLEILEKYDGLATLRLAEKCRGRPFRAQLPQLVELAKTDPRRAVETVMATNDDWASHEALGLMFRLWGEQDGEAAMDKASTISSQYGPALRKAAFELWIASDLAKAEAWLSERRDRKIQDELRPTLMKEWGKSDPESALNHCLTSLSGLRQSKAIANFLVGVSSEDQSVALNLLNQLPDEVTTRRVAVALTHEAFLSNDGSFGPAHPSRRKSTPSKEILKIWFEKQNDPSIAEAVLLAHGEKLQRFAPEFKEQLTPEGEER